MFPCRICNKSIKSHENLVQHMNVLHAETIVLYMCPICGQGIRWPKNFPTHYKNVHQKDYQEGLDQIKCLKTKIVPNTGYINPTGTVTSATKNVDALAVSTTSGNDSLILLEANSMQNDTISSINRKEYCKSINLNDLDLMIPAKVPKNGPPTDDLQILFSHNAEIFRSGLWAKGTIKMVKESGQNRLIFTVNGENVIQTILSAGMQYTPVTRTTVKLTGNEFLEEGMPTEESTIRFKKIQILDNFLKVWSNIHDQLSTRAGGIVRDCSSLVDQSVTGDVRRAEKTASEAVSAVQWICSTCDIHNTDDICHSCGESKNWICPSCCIAYDSSHPLCPSCDEQKYGMDLETNDIDNLGNMKDHVEEAKPQNSLVPFRIEPISAMMPMPRMIKHEQDITILFDHQAKMYRLCKKNNQWVVFADGNIQVSAAVNIANEVQLSMHSEKNLSISCNQSIGKDTYFEKSQMSDGVLTWIGVDLSKTRGEQEQWAIQFDDANICKQMYDIITIATAITNHTDIGDLSTPESLHRLLEHCTEESAENFKKRCVQAKMAKEVQDISKNMQTWYDFNMSLGITTESKKRFYEQLCQKLNESNTN